LSNQPDAFSGAPPHVLIVEDSEDVSSALKVLVEASGARVSVGRSVAETLAVGVPDPARLVLVDLTLPDGDGLTIIEPLRRAGSGMFVALTGRDDQETVERCRAAGCADVLVKPVPARQLVAKIKAWLEETVR
jgi:two-component system KDP operon response regulator KdpE